MYKCVCAAYYAQCIQIGIGQCVESNKILKNKVVFKDYHSR